MLACFKYSNVNKVHLNTGECISRILATFAFIKIHLFLAYHYLFSIFLGHSQLESVELVWKLLIMIFSVFSNANKYPGG